MAEAEKLILEELHHIRGQLDRIEHRLHEVTDGIKEANQRNHTNFVKVNAVVEGDNVDVFAEVCALFE